MQRIFLINLLWQKALSCQAFPAKKKISDKKCDIFSIIFWSSQPTSGIASGILKTKYRTTAGRSPPAMPCFSAAQRLCLRNVPPPRKQLRNTKTACRTFPSADGLQLRQQESNLRWGSQSPLPYRLAMAHCAKQYIIFSGFSQEAPACFLPRGGRSSFMKNFWGFAEKPCQTVAVVVRCGGAVIQGRAGMPPPPGRHRKRCGARLLPGK